MLAVLAAVLLLAGCCCIAPGHAVCVQPTTVRSRRAAHARHPSNADEPAACEAHPVVLLSTRLPMLAEVEDMYAYGLSALGHQVSIRTVPDCGLEGATFGVEAARECALLLQQAAVLPEDGPGSVYFVSWYCMMYHECQDVLPPATVIIQVEPTAIWSGRPCYNTPSYLTPMRDTVVWEYAARNVDFFKRKRKHTCSVFELIPYHAYPGITDGDYSGPAAAGEAGRDIDVLFLGGTWEYTGIRRRRLLEELAGMGLKVVELDGTIVPGFNMYSNEVRESYLRRAKVLLNVHRGEEGVDMEASYEDIPLEVVRLQYVLAAHAFVISEDANAAATRPYREAGAVVFAPYSQLAATVLEWLGRPADRHAVSDRGYSFIYSRDMGEVLRAPMQRAIQHLHGLTCAYGSSGRA